MAKSKNVIKKTTYETTAQALNRKLGYARYQGFEVGESNSKRIRRHGGYLSAEMV